MVSCSSVSATCDAVALEDSGVASSSACSMEEEWSEDGYRWCTILFDDEDGAVAVRKAEATAGAMTADTIA